MNDFEYRKSYTVPFDTDGFRLLPFLLSCMEQTAKEDAIRLGQGTDVLKDRYNAAWMILRTDLQVLVPISAGLCIEIVTWSRGIHGASVLRDFQIMSHGRELARATQLWVVADLTSRRLRNPRFMPELDTPCPLFAFSNTASRFDMPQARSFQAALTVKPEDIDENGHMNNVRYLVRALPYLPQNGNMPYRLLLQYNAELLCNQTFQCLTGSEDQIFSLVFRKEDKEHFQLKLQPIAD